MEGDMRWWNSKFPERESPESDNGAPATWIFGVKGLLLLLPRGNHLSLGSALWEWMSLGCPGPAFTTL